MSERSQSPNDYYELKHVRTLKIAPAETTLKKKRTLLYTNKEKLERDYIKTNLSCDCSECGQNSSYIQTIKKQYPFIETRWQKRKRILRRLRAVVNAVIFIQSYKVEVIKKFKKRMHILKAVRQLTTIKKSQIIPPSIPQPLINMPIIPQNKQSLRIKTTPDEDENINSIILSREPRKSVVSIYMNKMLKDVIPKSEASLKPLSHFDRKKIKQFNFKSITQTTFSHDIHNNNNHQHYHSNVIPYQQVITNKSNNLYKVNNKDILKAIDSLKVKHRIIRCKK